jgi:hypothetical protein
MMGKHFEKIILKTFLRHIERKNLLKRDYLLVDSHNILSRWENYFSQLLNVHDVSDVM